MLSRPLWQCPRSLFRRQTRPPHQARRRARNNRNSRPWAERDRACRRHCLQHTGTAWVCGAVASRLLRRWPLATARGGLRADFSTCGAALAWISALDQRHAIGSAKYVVTQIGIRPTPDSQWITPRPQVGRRAPARAPALHPLPAGGGIGVYTDSVMTRDSRRRKTSASS